jgi:two-component system, response regulator PdtaR
MSNTVQPVISNLNTVIYPTRVVLAQRVLVVDDEPMICLLLSEMIEQMGHGVCGSASSTAVALALTVLHKPDLLIVDAWLGEDSGLDTVAKIIETNFIPHIYITGNIQWLRNLRPDVLALEKPFREPALAMAIQLALGDWPVVKQ